jgi:GT2 family glycosyltransferase
VDELPDDLPGDYVVLVDAGDTLAPSALFEVANSILHEGGDLLYTDCDTLAEDGQYNDPFFKPGWSPEMLYSVNYVEHLLVISRALWMALQPYRNPWDMALRAAERPLKVVHIPQVLYHRNTTSHPSHADAVAAALTRKGFRSVKVTQADDGHIVAEWIVRKRKSVTVIIPNLNQPALLSACLEGLFSTPHVMQAANHSPMVDVPQAEGIDASVNDFEVLVVDTGSSDPDTLALYREVAKRHPNFRVIHDKMPFNFSRACNLGAASSDAAVLLFLNNDTRILHRDWLERMIQWLELPEVGIVGAKLLYPDGRIQHGGVIIGLSGLADHLFAGAPEGIRTPFGRDDWVRNVMAVTGACLMIRRTVFDQVGGFDEGYRLMFSDVALCAAAHRVGWRVVITPAARLLHYEAATHQGNVPLEDMERAASALRPILYEGDPYYNPNLTVRWRIPLLNGGERDRPLSLLQDALSAAGSPLRVAGPTL